MKISTILLPLLSLVSLAVAASEEFQPTDEKPYEIRITYLVKDKQEVITDPVYIENGETASIEFTVKNDEDADLTIVGVAGSFNNPATGEIVSNVTATQLGPVPIPPGESVNFIQRIGLDLNPDSYLFVPAIYVFFNDKLMLLGARNQLLSIADPKISIFNPQLLFLELVLVASLAGIGYVVYNIFGRQYFEGATPKKSSKALAPAPAAAATGAKLDDSWIPAHHLRSSTKKTKKTK